MKNIVLYEQVKKEMRYSAYTVLSFFFYKQEKIVSHIYNIDICI